jgi:hypothetical protein
VDDVGVLGRTAEGSAHRAEDDGSEPRLAAKPGHEAGVTSEAAIALRPDDRDLDAARLEPFDEVGDEAPGEVALAAWIRRREDGDLQGARILVRETEAMFACGESGRPGNRWIF